MRTIDESDIPQKVSEMWKEGEEGGRERKMKKRREEERKGMKRKGKENAGRSLA